MALGGTGPVPSLCPFSFGMREEKSSHACVVGKEHLTVLPNEQLIKEERKALVHMVFLDVYVLKQYSSK